MSSTADPVQGKRVGTGLGGWVGHLVDSAAAIPGNYGRILARNRRRTILLTLLAILGILYPIIYVQVLAPFSRNVYPLPFPDETVVTFMMIFGIMAIGLNIVAGFAGLLDLGYVAFYAIGAYTAAFFASPHFASLSIVLFANVAAGFPGIHLPFWIVLPAAALIAATFGALLGAPTLRLRGDYLAIVTLGFGEIVPVFFRNLAAITFTFSIAGVTIFSVQNVNLTGGPLGINPIDPFVIVGIGFGATSGVAAVYFGMLLTIIAIVVARNLERSRMGRAWGAIREDETAAEMMGVNTVRTKLLAFALGASFAGVAGAFQASYLGATTSDFFNFAISIQVLVMVILGGIGNIWGVLAGAIVLVYIDKTFLIWLGQRLSSITSEIPNPSQFNFLLLGILLVAMMRFRPEGFLPSRQRAAELTLAGLQDAEAELGVEIETDNVEIAPVGQAELDRRAELPGEMEDE
jgi:branched-chain amino acid transport system permease protein